MVCFWEEKVNVFFEGGEVKYCFCGVWERGLKVNKSNQCL